MMTQQLEVSILAAPVAAIDRRALSQAWYSALHLALSETPSGAHASPIVARERFDFSTASRIDARGESRPGALTVVQKASPRPARAPATAASAANSAATPRKAALLLERRIERKFADPRIGVKRATFSIGNGGARVHVVLQTTQTTVVLIALCRPEMRHVVARALARARSKLAPAGVQIAALPGGAVRCS